MEFQVKASVFGNIKVLKLSRRLGPDGVLSLFRLWAYVAEFAPKGVLEGASPEDLELAAAWTGRASDFYSALVDLRLIDINDGQVSVHNWAEHNVFLATGRGKREKQPVDFRLSTAFARHPKIVKLFQGWGAAGIVGWLRLLAYTCVEHPDGTLGGRTLEDLAIVTQTGDKVSSFAKALYDLGLLDVGGWEPVDDENIDCDQADMEPRPPFAIHNWRTRQPFRSSFPERSAKAKMANMAKKSKKEAKYQAALPPGEPLPSPPAALPLPAPPPSPPTFPTSPNVLTQPHATGGAAPQMSTEDQINNVFRTHYPHLAG